MMAAYIRWIDNRGDVLATAIRDISPQIDAAALAAEVPGAVRVLLDLAV